MLCHWLLHPGLQDSDIMGYWLPSVNCEWKVEKTHLPSEQLRNVSELIDGPDDLKIAAANGQNMLYKGWIGATFKLAADGSVVVPIPVMKGQQVCQPIIGYNVIEQTVTVAVNHPDENREQLHITSLHNVPMATGENGCSFVKQTQHFSTFYWDICASPREVGVLGVLQHPLVARG